MTRLSLLGWCAAVSLCAPRVQAWADEAPTAPPAITQPTISLVATASKSDVAAFLKSPVSFTVKGASFLGALDAVLTSSGKTCSIECRQMKPMKLTFGAKGQTADGVLDTLAKAGGGSLYIFSDKLLLSPAGLLSKEEKASGKPYSVLLSKATLPLGKTLDNKPGAIDMLAIANQKISCSIKSEDIGSSGGFLIGSVTFGTPNFSLYQRASVERIKAGLGVKHLSLSFQDVPLGEALGMLAHIDGCELFLLPGKFLICPANGLTPEEQRVAVPAFQYPGFGSPSPSASNS